MVNENDYVWVRLTQFGADWLNKENKDCNEFWGDDDLKIDYKEDDIFSDLFKCIMLHFTTQQINFKDISFTELK